MRIELSPEQAEMFLNNLQLSKTNREKLREAVDKNERIQLKIRMGNEEEFFREITQEVCEHKFQSIEEKLENKDIQELEKEGFSRRMVEEFRKSDKSLYDLLEDKDTDLIEESIYSFVKAKLS